MKDSLDKKFWREFGEHCNECRVMELARRARVESFYFRVVESKSRKVK